MVDNVTLNSGSGGATLATDDISGVMYQRVKITHGADGVASETTTSAPFPITSIGPPDSQISTGSSVAVSAGSSADIDSSQIGSSKTGYLQQVIASASVPIKLEIKTVQNGVESSTLLTDIGMYGSVHVDIVNRVLSQAQDAGAGLDGFRATVTNLDPTAAADLYATLVWYEE